MYVLIVASKYPPEHSGSGKRLHELYKRLTRSNLPLQWQVLSTRGGDCATGWFEGIHVYRVPGARTLKPSLPNPIRKIAELLLGIGEGLFSLMFLERVGRDRLQLIHTCGWSWCVIAASFWGKWRGVPVVRELTSMTDHPFNPSWMRPIIRATLRSATRIVAISPFLEKKCVDGGFGGKVWCRPNPIDEKRFRPVSPQEKINLRSRLFPEMESEEGIWMLNIGRIRPLKNQLTLVRLLSRLPSIYRLVLAGPVDPSHHSYLEEIRNSVHSLGLGKRVIIHVGNHPNPESYMQSSDLFLFPSISEGLGTVMLEALMCGLPVVSSRIEGVTDSVIEDKKNGFLVDFETEEAVRAVNAAVALFDRKDRIALHARRRFGAGMIDRQYFDLLQGLVPG